MGRVLAKLEELGHKLPEAAAPAANYVAYTRVGNIVYVAGQLPIEDGKPGFIGKLGREISIEDGKQAAQLCSFNALAHLCHACGGTLDKVKQIVKLEILVNATEDFTEPHVVANGASDLMAEVFGDKGKHARAAYCVAQLPFGAAVEVVGTFEVSD